jgi:hypothetical protein
MVVTEINGVKGFLDLDCRFYPVNALKDACDRFEKEHPDILLKGKGECFRLFDALMSPEPEDTNWQDIVQAVRNCE